ncbi:MAG: hypothetical protein IKW35_03425 [Paludibacteraceae bacterium]|nr:hypothetical protein [Paludibacteraceae bacterium]
MSRKVLLIEPNYKNKFPPIGLMKMATYFRMRGDDVIFFKGELKDFLLDWLTSLCINKFVAIDDTINWRLRGDKIKQYIKRGQKSDFSAIGLYESQYEVLLYPWIDQYRKEFKTGNLSDSSKFDFVGVTTLFTFYWDITIKTIEFAKTLVKDINRLQVGGVLASIQPEEIYEATGIKPHCGTLHSKGDIDPDNNEIIDNLPLDYSILDEIDYVYPDNNAYFSYTTRGCIRNCAFCAVKTLEPNYIDYIPLKERINRTRRLYGEQQNLLLMDNNVMASQQFMQIIQDIKDCGFEEGDKYIETNQYDLAIRNLRLHINDRAYTRKAFKLLQSLTEMKRFSEEERTDIYTARDKFGLLSLDTCTREALIKSYHIFAPYFTKRYSGSKGKRRIIDFNQGVDARLFTNEIVKALSEVAIRPLRIAFDDIKTQPQYLNAIELSINNGLKDFSNYLLYNFQDKPEDLYERMRINVDLCEQYNVNIYSFPMKYHPIRGEHSHDRDYIGKYWNRKYIRAVQAILNATKGKIGRGKSFFEKAFGKNIEEYKELLIMPETFILYRFFFEYIGYTDAWREEMKQLSVAEMEELQPLIFQNDFNNIESLTTNKKLLHILSYYKNYRYEIIDSTSELYRRKKEFDALTLK